MSERRAGILRELGLAPVWRLRQPACGEGRPAADRAKSPVLPASTVCHEVPTTPHDDEPANALAHAPAADPPSPAGSGWAQLEAEIRGCTACPLHLRRNKPVPGVGDPQPDWLMVGEGPGAEEDRRGEPFVGPAGQLLDAMLAAVGLSRERGAFIANAVKCRPPNNRTPEVSEIATCFPYLERQIALLRPRLIVALGRPAAQSLLNQEIRISAVRGRAFSFSGIPLVITYHPAYLLRNPHDKAKAWEDLCLARKLAPPGARAASEQKQDP